MSVYFIGVGESSW